MRPSQRQTKAGSSLTRRISDLACLSIGAAALALCISGQSVADNVHASIRKPTNIPAQDLGPALQTLAKDRNFQIVYVSEQINVLRTKGASGELTSEEALRQLLNGTGFTFKYLDEKTVTIVPAGTHTDPAKSPAGSTPLVSAPAVAAASTPAAADDMPREGKKSFWNRLRLAQVSTGQSVSLRPDGSARGN